MTTTNIILWILEDNGMGRTKWLSALNLINWLNWWRIQSRGTSTSLSLHIIFWLRVKFMVQWIGWWIARRLPHHTKEEIICIVCVHGHARETWEIFSSCVNDFVVVNLILLKKIYSNFFLTRLFLFFLRIPQ